MRRIAASLLTSALVVLTLLVAPLGASADRTSATDGARVLATNGTYPLKNDHSGKCLEVYGWSQANGGNVVQWDCHYGANQLWTFVRHGDGSYSLKNLNSGKCLDVYAWSQANGGDVVQWECHWGANQRWVQTWSDDTASFRYLSRHSGKALEVYGWSQADGGDVVQWEWHGGANQRWR